MKAFYFATRERKLRYGDGRPIVVGETHTVDVRPRPCVQGLHASKQLLDALSYAPGTILYLVELGGVVVETNDKVCATSRTYLAEFDATELLVKFACQRALSVVEKIRPYTKDYDLIVRFLEAPDAADASRAAHAAAAADAAHAARAAAHAAAAAAAAARAAAHAAAARVDSTADAAAVDAADAARAAADAAADAGVKNQQNDLLTQMVKEATGWDL